MSHAADLGVGYKLVCFSTLFATGILSACNNNNGSIYENVKNRSDSKTFEVINSVSESERDILHRVGYCFPIST